MGNSLLKADKKQAKGEIDQIAVDYRLKLIAFQDELFQSRKKLQDSDRKMVDLQKKLDEYVRNKENQIAEVMFTAHMNAQRIETQVRSQTEYIILEMEEEMRRKQKELELLQKKTNQFADDNLSDMDGEDIGVRLQVVQDNIRAFREEIETTSDVPAQNSKPTKSAKVTELKPDKEHAVPTRTEAKSDEKPDLIVTGQSTETNQTTETGLELEQAVQTQDEKVIPENQTEAAQPKLAVPPTVPNKRRVVSKKSSKAKKEKVDPGAAETPLENQDMEPQLPTIGAKAKDQEQEPAASITESYAEAGLDNFRPASQVEPNERMRLDAFVDVRYYQVVKGQKEMQHHALQVTIEVEVPPDNYSVRYTKVSSDVVSTLLQYDNVILNDIFPFNIVDPDPQNIAMYFFNCLDDMLSMMDLVLHSLVVLELPDLQIRVNNRNTKLDNFLHQGVDSLNSIRDSLKPCVEIEPDSGSPFKGITSRILKKRN